MTKRAAKGGQVGANGEWYEGGKFIATTDAPKGKPAKAKVTRKEQYEPYKWAVAPETGMRPILVAVGSSLNPIRQNGGWTQVTVNEEYADYCMRTHGTNKLWGYTPSELAEMWNSGIRWIMPK